MARPRRGPAAAIAAIALCLASNAEANEAAAAEEASVIRPDLALMGTIPIYWGEVSGVEELLAGHASPHWARERLERAYRLAPIDYLDAATLGPHARLLLAQPRGLSPQENVALDSWVRQGGRLLLFADPMMTGDSRFGIGDRRRPQDVALLSPILAHWGLRLEFDEDQAAGLMVREIAGTSVPVNLAGRLALSTGGEASCRLGEHPILAECRLGLGRIVILADAALLDIAGPWPGAPEALDRLAMLAFAESGEIAGEDIPIGDAASQSDANPLVREQANGPEAGALPLARGRESTDNHLVPH